MQTEASLDGVVMNVVETSGSSVIGPGTIFRFTQHQEVVRADYEGGRIIAGSLVGYRDGAQLRFGFCQLESPACLQTGQSMCCVRRQNGALEVVEDFQWDDPERPPGRNILREIV